MWKKNKFKYLMNCKQISIIIIGSMLTRNLGLPIPFFCLVLLLMTLTKNLEMFITGLVEKILSTHMPEGLLIIWLTNVFIGFSLLRFSMASRTIQHGFRLAHTLCGGWVGTMCWAVPLGTFWGTLFLLWMWQILLIKTQEPLSISHGQSYVVSQGGEAPGWEKLLITCWRSRLWSYRRIWRQ